MPYHTIFLFFIGLVAPPEPVPLPEIRVTDIRMGMPDSLVAYRIDRIRIEPVHGALTLGDVLLRAGTTVRGYGPGVLQTVGFRGFSASQTQVLWNGWSINHGMVGVTDLSLVPAFLLDEVAVNRGGGSAEYGNAALGGTVELGSSARSGYSAVQSGAGSAGLRSLGARTRFDVDGWSTALGVFRREAENDFEYRDVFQAPVVRRKRQNAATELTAVTLDRRQDRGDQIRYLSVWLSGTDSEIPGPISAGTSLATQEDALSRIAGGISRKFGSGWIGADALLSAHRLDYADPASLTDSRSRISTVGMRAYWAMPGLRIQSDIRSSDIEFTEYDAPKRVESSLGATFRKHGSQLSGRIDHDSRYGVFWSASAGHRTTHFRAHVARSFGVPTFNDLHWPLLGNPDLVPETALKAEFGIVGRFGPLRWDVPIHASRIRDGIQWIPQNDGRVRPVNIREVGSIGAEPELRFDASAAGWTLNTRTQVSHTRARYLKARFPGDQSVNRKVAYVPEWSALAEAGLTYDTWTLAPVFRYTGERFTTEDERFPMPAVGVWDVALSKTFRTGRLQSILMWRIDNLTNQEHSLIRWYPMPGRQHHVSLTLQIP